MLAYEAAIERILAHVPAPKAARVPLQEALGCVLARAVVAGADLPGFNNSAVDGYALCVTPYNDLTHHSLRLIGQAEAGKPFRGLVRNGQVVRIFTGAPLPLGANAVVMQERVRVSPSGVLLSEPPEIGQHIRRRGEDIGAGKTVLKPGAVLRAQEIGLLAALGQSHVVVWSRPRIAVLTTGNELRPAGRRLAAGQIYDSNSAMLTALVQETGGLVRTSQTCPDSLSRLVRTLRSMLSSAKTDVILLAGGVSVGDKDLCREAFAKCGIRQIFWRVNIKPGMPFFFGKKGRALIFGLPGNPVSSYVTFREFAAPALAKLQGRAWQDPYSRPASLTKDLHVSKSRETHFVRVTSQGSNGTLTVAALDGQGSHHLRSLVEAQGWMRLRSSEGPWAMGARVLVRTDGAFQHADRASQ